MKFKDIILSDLVSLAKIDSSQKLGIECEMFALSKNNGKLINHSIVSELLSKVLENNQSLIYEGSNLNLNENNPLGFHGNNFSMHLEPGCQIEVSLNPVSDLSSLCENFNQAMYLLSTIMDDYCFLNYGINPISNLENVPFLQKNRYFVMWNYMFKNNIFGHMMMKLTCTMQFNIDYSSEIDAYKKFLGSIIVQPILIALFANSRFMNGVDTDFASYRSYIWQGINQKINSDIREGHNSRAGIPGFIFSCNKNDFFSSYINYCMNVSMSFCYRDGKYIVFEDKYTFLDFINGRVQQDIIDGVFVPKIVSNFELLDMDFSDINVRKYIADILQPTSNDWYNHVNTIFFETRIQRGYIEMRSLDSCPREYLFAASDFWLQFMLREDLLDFIINDLFDEKSITEEYINDLYFRAAKFGIQDQEILHFSKKLISVLDNNSNAYSVFNELIKRDPKKDILDIKSLAL